LFLHKSNIIFKTIFSKFVWDIPSIEPTIYLTFDDGPIPEITEFVLNELKNAEAKATFFCIGENVLKNPEIFNKILSNGHSIGNHTYNHLNGWKADNQLYINNFEKCSEILPNTNLFRPPYGKIGNKQAKYILKTHKIVMWDVISGDFSPNISKEVCLAKCIKYTESGTVIVFHDSVKAYENMRYVLPRYIAYFKEKGFKLEAIKID
jgi:peptidoglycan-N-acetylglucosamine deacetylase